MTARAASSQPTLRFPDCANQGRALASHTSKGRCADTRDKSPPDDIYCRKSIVGRGKCDSLFLENRAISAVLNLHPRAQPRVNVHDMTFFSERNDPTSDEGHPLRRNISKLTEAMKEVILSTATVCEPAWESRLETRRVAWEQDRMILPNRDKPFANAAPDLRAGPCRGGDTSRDQQDCAPAPRTI